jgi:hypothetical protein
MIERRTNDARIVELLETVRRLCIALLVLIFLFGAGLSYLVQYCDNR